MERKRKKRTAWIQVRTTNEAKEFLKSEFGSESDFVRSAIIKAAHERNKEIQLV
jgi:hypothetical protein